MSLDFTDEPEGTFQYSGIFYKEKNSQPFHNFAWGWKVFVSIPNQVNFPEISKDFTNFLENVPTPHRSLV